MFTNFNILVFLVLTTCQAVNSQSCYGERCETPKFLEDTEHCVGLGCESKESLLQMISDLQKEKYDEYMAPLKNPLMINKRTSKEVILKEVFLTGQDDIASCSICNNTALCLNGGACVPDPTNPWKYFHCICPENTSGENCQNIIDCKTNNTCGQNTICYVANHQLNCVCKPGYTARQNGRDCDLKVQKSCMNGDPHYITFDNMHYDYQGTCPYVFSQPCTNLTEPFSWYSVRAKNELPGQGTHVSQVSEVEVDMHNMTIHIDGRSKTVLVNSVQVLTPWFYPNKDNWIVRIRFSGNQYIVENEQGVTVTFTTTYALCVSVPDIPEFRGNQTLCGLAGNLDGLWQDDVVNRNGTVLPIHHSYQPDSDNRVEFLQTEDSWITDKFLVLRPGQENCLNGEVIDNNTHCDVSTAAQYCYSIQLAETGIGPFAACQGLGNETLESFYYNCIYDVCHDPNYKCTALTYFMQYCQLSLPESQQDPDWRNEVNCPLACPVNSHHSVCTSSCPSSCSELYPEECDQACFDGCECDAGYVIDNSVTGSIRCIRVDQCGCNDDNGNTHKPNTPWLTDNCTIWHECRNGSMYSEYKPCDPYAVCALNSIEMQCQCEHGFRGNGYNCTDINECKETPGICGTHGQCFNTPGSYYCECDTYYVGNACESYKPRRHCADLYVYWGNRTDGVYSINPPYALPLNKSAFAPSLVYCDMTTSGGGFTLISSDVSNLNENKTYQNYVNGFGEPKNRTVWLGLEFIYQMTTNQSQTLRLNLDRCAGNGRPARLTDCTYSTFSILDASTQYSVIIRETCTGSEAGDNYYQDGWARWDLSKNGPKFSTWDLELKSSNQPQNVEKDAFHACSCSQSNLNTGWWYIEDQLCGSANLNAVRYTCPNVPLESEKYLRWSQGTLGQASMYLRPVGYPNYDNHGK